MNNAYDPSNYNESTVRDYGGYFDEFSRGFRGGRDRFVILFTMPKFKCPIL